jgi:5-methylcytosine-specific restriction endonuclease McrA
LRGVKSVPRKRPPEEIWQERRRETWERDAGRCTHCGVTVALDECHIDHIRSGKLGGNELANLRTLCRRCHVLRADNRHRGMVAGALRDGIIPPDWRGLVWEDE